MQNGVLINHSITFLAKKINGVDCYSSTLVLFADSRLADYIYLYTYIYLYLHEFEPPHIHVPINAVI